MSPIGLQGLDVAKSIRILAKVADNYNVPFILSTVGTSDIETIAEITKWKSVVSTLSSQGK